MSDEPSSPPPPAEPTPPPERARVDVPRRRRWDLLPLLYLVGFVVLAGSLFFLYRNPPLPEQARQDSARVQSLQAQLQGLREQVAQMQSRPAPSSAAQPDVTRLQERVAALENRPAPAAGAPDQALTQRVAALENRPTPDLGPLAARVDSLEKRTPPDLGPLDQRIAALEQRPQVDLGPLTSRVEQLAAQGRTVADQIDRRLDAIETRIGTVEALAKQTAATADAIDQRVGAVEAQAKQTASTVDAIKGRAERVALLQAASAALAAGQKVPPIPGAPPALARFASEQPPTEASLRQSFETYADQAQKASQPAIMDNRDLGARLWNRAQQVVTVRQGDRVLLGDPIAGVIAHAREALDAGDLAGAVKSLDGLAGPAAAAMKPWVEQARALLDARSAIASMAAG